MDGPPATKAATQTAMKAPDVPMMSTCPAPDSPDADGLEDCCGSADQQRRKDGPRYVALGLPGNPGHDDHRQDHRRRDDHGCLKA